jgi:hypothetical protein
VNAHEQQQFFVLLQTTVDQYAERLIQRNDGPERARQRLAETPEEEGVWLSAFVDAVFRDSLMDNAAGACFVLEALERRPLVSIPEERTIGGALAALARAAFATLLQQKTLEELDRRSSYQAVEVPQ